MADLEELAGRVERLSGPDAAVGREVLLACGYSKAIVGHFMGPMYQWSLPGRINFDDGNFHRHDPTASIDAAMTLVPEGLRLMLSEWDDEKHLRARGPWQAVLSKPGADASFDMMRGYRCEHAATPALAIVAAALRARLLSSSGEG